MEKFRRKKNEEGFGQEVLLVTDTGGLPKAIPGKGLMDGLFD